MIYFFFAYFLVGLIVGWLNLYYFKWNTYSELFTYFVAVSITWPLLVILYVSVLLEDMFNS